MGKPTQLTKFNRIVAIDIHPYQLPGLALPKYAANYVACQCSMSVRIPYTMRSSLTKLTIVYGYRHVWSIRGGGGGRHITEILPKPAK